MVTSLFNIVSEVITKLVSAISSCLTSVMGIFYDTTASNFTILGTLALISVGAGIVYLCIRVVRKFIAVKVA